MSYKMIAMDLDGTLTNSEKKIPTRTFELLMRAQEEGIILVLASGRTDLGMKKLADELQLERYGGYVLSFNGAKIINWKTKEVVFSAPVPETSLNRIYRISEEHNIPLLAHENDHLIVLEPDNPYIIEEAWINQMPIQKIDSYESYVNFPIYKFIAVGDGEYLAGKEPIVREALREECDVYRSTPYFLEIVAKHVEKAKGLAQLAKLHDIPREEIIAVGDGYNDIRMIEYAGLGVAMANAEEAAKKRADFITKSNDEEGIAWLLEKFVFKEAAE